MHRAEVVRVMLAWIEENISGRLTLDEVTCRSGYSKWHFQRIFREETGKILGQYLRERRLTHTAFELRLSKKSITDIAWDHGFDSVQAFTRSFKRQFQVTPAVYRKSPSWPYNGMCPPIRLELINAPPMNIVLQQEIRLLGRFNYYSYPRCRIDDGQLQLWMKYWVNFISALTSRPKNLVGLINYHAGEKKTDSVDFSYVTCVKGDEQGDEYPDLHAINIPGGMYACFYYKGVAEKLNEFICHIYDTWLPLKGLNRLNGYDVIKYSIDESPTSAYDMKNIEIEYCIPI